MSTVTKPSSVQYNHYSLHIHNSHLPLVTDTPLHQCCHLYHKPTTASHSNNKGTDIHTSYTLIMTVY